jgi:hypothetical protein
MEGKQGMEGYDGYERKPKQRSQFATILKGRRC